MAERRNRDTRDELLEHALDQLCRATLRPLAAIVHVDDLIGTSGITRPTVSRQLGVASEVVAAAAERLWTMERSGVADVLAAMTEASVGAAPTEETLRAALAVNFDKTVANSTLVGSWVLHTCAANASAAVAPRKGHDGLVERDLAAARQVLAARSRFYAEMGDQFAPLLEYVVRSLGRELTIPVDKLVLLMHSMLDGLVLRHLVDPDLVTADTASEALFHLAHTYSVDREIFFGTDPLLPRDADAQAEYRRCVEKAIAEWENTRPGQRVDLDTIAVRADVTIHRLKELFDITDGDGGPDITRLVDSCLRVVLPTTLFEHRGSALLSTLALVNQIKSTYGEEPALYWWVSSDRYPAEGSYRGHLEQLIVVVLTDANEQGEISCHDPAGAARNIVAAALSGEDDIARFLLRTVCEPVETNK